MKLGRRGFLNGAAALLCVPDKTRSQISDASPALGSVSGIADSALGWLRANDGRVLFSEDAGVDRLWRADADASAARANKGRELTLALSRLDPSALPDHERLFAATLADEFTRWQAAPIIDRYSFAVTSFAAAQTHGAVEAILGAHPFERAEDVDRYGALIEDYGRLIDDMFRTTREQARKGIRLARPALPGVRALLQDVISRAPQFIAVADTRLAKLQQVQRQRLQATISLGLSQNILPRMNALLALFDRDYATAAPIEPGLSHVTGSAEAYQNMLFAQNGGRDTPEQIHALGHERLAQIGVRQSELRAHLNGHRDPIAFKDALSHNRDAYVANPAEIEAVYRHAMDKITPKLGDWFERLPRAPWALKRLGGTSENGITYGYYQEPTPADRKGYYRYNGSGLRGRTIITAQHLIYHELLPGHHLQIGLALEAPPPHPFQRQIYSNVFAEGWAEYGAGLAEEAGVYECMSLYGHLAFQAFFAARLVVDTGLNALGWTQQRAADFMALHTLEHPKQIASEILRYGCDTPAQATGYALGHFGFNRLRDNARQREGASFDLRKFHTHILNAGPAPFTAIEAVLNSSPRARAKP
jgi:uncharacterized protein (DUF885 family)